MSGASSGGATRIGVGTRGGALALLQTRRDCALLSAVAPHPAFEPVVVRTQGDIDKTSPLTAIGGRGVFTSDLHDALVAGAVDLAVHSAKDLPAREHDGCLILFPEREDPRDVVVSRHGVGLADLPPNPRVGTSSRRRALQVLAIRPDARIVELRGNVDTRLQKAAGEEYDAIVLAAAGLGRMGLQDRVTGWLDLAEFVPSPGQGALAVEVRAEASAIVGLVRAIEDPRVSLAVRCERAFLAAMGAGCTTPVGAHVSHDAAGLRLWAVYGETPVAMVREDVPLDPGDPERHAARIAAAMVERFGASFGEAVRPKVLVTRAREQAADLVASLRQAGAEPVELPTLRFAPPDDHAPLDAALRRAAAGEYDWIAVTSANGARSVAGRLASLGMAPASLGAARIASVGEATAAALAEAGLGVDLIAGVSTAEGLAEALRAAEPRPSRVLYPRSEIARDALAEGLRAHGIAVDDPVAYRTLPAEDADPETRERVAGGGIDVVTFASPSSVRNLAAMLGTLDPIRSARIVCVGPVTAAAARDAGLPVHAVADDPGVPGMMAAVMQEIRSLTAGTGRRMAEAGA